MHTQHSITPAVSGQQHSFVSYRYMQSSDCSPEIIIVVIVIITTTVLIVVITIVLLLFTVVAEVVTRPPGLLRATRQLHVRRAWACWRTRR